MNSALTEAEYDADSDFDEDEDEDDDTVIHMKNRQRAHAPGMGASLRKLQLGGLNILDALTQVTTISQQN